MQFSQEVLKHCTKCRTTGKGICYKCEGKGKDKSNSPCAKCSGTGKMTCYWCKGSGKYYD